MKTKNVVKAIFPLLLLIPALKNFGQQKLSLDLALVRNIHHQLNGLNVSSFYHFNDRITGGLELNRFFSVTRSSHEEPIQVSAWDFDLNFHFLFPIKNNTKIYPVTGISHTSEKERIISINESRVEKFWSYNTGAGFLWEKGRWAPHIEYIFTWSRINQQFLLVGLSYELEFGDSKQKKEIIQ